jgi:hypothetical protein
LGSRRHLRTFPQVLSPSPGGRRGRRCAPHGTNQRTPAHTAITLRCTRPTLYTDPPSRPSHDDATQHQVKRRRKAAPTTLPRHRSDSSPASCAAGLSDARTAHPPFAGSCGPNLPRRYTLATVSTATPPLEFRYKRSG